MPIILPTADEMVQMSWNANERAKASVIRYVSTLGLEPPTRIVYVRRAIHTERRRPLRDSDVRRCKCGAWRIKGDECATCAMFAAGRVAA